LKTFLAEVTFPTQTVSKVFVKRAEKSAKSEQKNGKSPELVSWRFILFAFLENLY